MEDKYLETFETWNNMADLYQEKFMNLSIYDETYDFICENLTKSQAKILDIGCGPGNITKYLLSKREDFVIHGIDISPNMIELAKINNPTANFSVMDIRKIDQLESMFDAVICGFCIPYLSSQETDQLIFNSAKLLNANGFLYISFVEGDPNFS
ncbi:class I SAM-dependent methyltransferase [Leptospira sp. GIMC2001]|uniref:class I SAM-dependent methyltransferase n=1 Tax=Leptospira sp. GIMC2001 TaxID=1513297 RepID=UPI0023494F1C|nr:class I SAM-dependent methyltransferase [Leptospira sp. GIMC2001]WCL47639.1 class I SAM-dependent methyltransferase [Leptospira sp. GIMC2001]